MCHIIWQLRIGRVFHSFGKYCKYFRLLCCKSTSTYFQNFQMCVYRNNQTKCTLYISIRVRPWDRRSWCTSVADACKQMRLSNFEIRYRPFLSVSVRVRLLVHKCVRSLSNMDIRVCPCPSASDKISCVRVRPCPCVLHRVRVCPCPSVRVHDHLISGQIFVRTENMSTDKINPGTYGTDPDFTTTTNFHKREPRPISIAADKVQSPLSHLNRFILQTKNAVITSPRCVNPKCEQFFLVNSEE